MDTRIRDFSGSLMAGTLGKMKETKTSQADSAFYSLFDSAVKNNAGKDTESALNQLTGNSSGAGTAEISAGQNVKKADDTTMPKETTDVQEKAQNADVAQDTEMTDVDKAQEVIKKFCKELGIDEEQLAQQMDGLLESVMTLLMQKFDVTEEQLEQVLGELGLDVVDMFEKTDLMSVLVELSGAEDISAVLTSEELYVQVQEVIQDIDMIQQSFGENVQLQPEELQQIAQCLEVVAQPEETVEEPELAVEGQVVEEVPETQTQVLEVVDDREPLRQESDGQEHSMTGQEGFQQFTTRVSQFVQETVQTGENPFVQTVDMEDIIQQVIERVKLDIQPDTTDIEMQLHPESYGKLNLHVSVREGVVTAQMAVENEMVRSALETQVVQLKDEMLAKGLKVDAVEVTIASHSFEQNLEEGQQQESDAQETNTHAHRQINLQNESMTLEDIMQMSEQEALARKIMLENGNSIDFSA